MAGYVPYKVLLYLLLLGKSFSLRPNLLKKFKYNYKKDIIFLNMSISSSLKVQISGKAHKFLLELTYINFKRRKYQ